MGSYFNVVLLVFLVSGSVLAQNFNGLSRQFPPNPGQVAVRPAMVNPNLAQRVPPPRPGVQRSFVVVQK
ncbi:hypothetical protein L596_010204 [Steinernema carpocapsae]|uniref:Uncharacterized protein n=1 Tax=Steinernema carpocapsae TaxID=34508 RepID=A0A4U5PIE1_STECR|nr:hypothetical protein L596_010204 [Steinernema carpocapsae]